MVLADASECIFFLRDKETRLFGALPVDVYEYEEVAECCWIRHRKGERAYPYGWERVKIVKPRGTLDPEKTVVRKDGRAFDRIDRIAVYDGCIGIRFSNGASRVYADDVVSLEENVLQDPRPRNVFDYLREVAATDGLVNERTRRPILEERYERIGSVSSGTVLSCYLSGSDPGGRAEPTEPLIYPFGLNASQKTAVERAFSRTLSVIQGPPGTGKTQTILNIVANNIMLGKTTAVVSNNASAVENVVEKLGHSGLDFVCALLGRGPAKEEFIGNQPGYPQALSDWSMPREDLQRLLGEVDGLVRGLTKALEDRTALAETEASIAAFEREHDYFKAYTAWREDVPARSVESEINRSSQTILRFWVKEERRFEESRPAGFWYRAYVRARLGGFYRDAVVRDDAFLVPLLQDAFYRAKLDELRRAARRLREGSYDFVSAMAAIEEKSLRAFKARLAERYGGKSGRRRFSLKDLAVDAPGFAREYPVVLSTTHSITSSLNVGFRYDSVLMDESSQINVAAGVLALSCAESVVIVGDHKQLANVVQRDRGRETALMADRRRVPACYRYELHSMLTSVLALWPEVETTLLKEHYRCHPKIIGFCNKMYYDGELVVMTEDKGEDDVLAFHRTVAGNHERNKMNRRQVAVVCEEIIPELFRSGVEDVGVIAPFNRQVGELKRRLPAGVPVATVHKFQGRENDTIVLSTVQNTIEEFVGDSHLVNVAVSRAVKKLRVVASQNERGSKSNDIEELARYMEYQGFGIVQSEIRSVFDLLYREYAVERARFLGRHGKVSRYDSENLMAAALEDMLESEGFARISFRCHVALATLVGEDVPLSPRERRYVLNPRTHVDFALYREMNKRPLLCVEVDAEQYHKEGTEQYARDRMKDAVLERCGLSLLRLRTDSEGYRHDVGKVAEMLRVAVSEVSDDANGAAT